MRSFGTGLSKSLCIIGLTLMACSETSWAANPPAKAKVAGCAVGKSNWFYENVNQKNVVSSETRKIQDGIEIHEWYVRPANHGTGNHFVLSYKEDPRFPRPRFAEQLLKADLATVGEFYFTCETAPERYLFTNGYTYSQFILTNYESCSESCTLIAATPLDLKNIPQPQSGKPNVGESLKNPNLRAAMELVGKPKVSEEKKNADSDFIPPSPRRAKLTKTEIKLGASFSPSEKPRFGSYQNLQKMPERVLRDQTGKP